MTGDAGEFTMEMAIALGAERQRDMDENPKRYLESAMERIAQLSNALNLAFAVMNPANDFHTFDGVPPMFSPDDQVTVSRDEWVRLKRMAEIVRAPI